MKEVAFWTVILTILINGILKSTHTSLKATSTIRLQLRETVLLLMERATPYRVHEARKE
jgi:hypothetical protein